MSDPLVSLIVPIYNVESYLPRCLESIANQTFQNFECILVDDGSSDGSGAICDEQAHRDPRFLVFHKQNGGVSSARNFGLDRARGAWLIFCDSDDAPHPQLLEWALAVQAQVTPHTMVCWKYGPEFPPHLPPHPGSVQLSPDELFLSGDFANIWGKLWDRALLNELDLHFDETLRWCEDLDFVTRYFLAMQQQGRALRLCLIPYVLYRYEEQRSGSVTSRYSLSKLIYEQQTLPEVLDLFQTQLGQDRSRWAPFCQVQLFTLISRLMDLYRYETDLSLARRRQTIRTYLASPPTRRLLVLCRQYHVWPAMQFCASHGLVRTAFFLERNCYKPWYMRLTRAWLWVKNKFYWGWQAVKGPFARRKG